MKWQPNKLNGEMKEHVCFLFDFFFNLKSKHQIIKQQQTVKQNTHKTLHTEEISNRLKFYEESKQNKTLCHEIINKKIIIEDNVSIINDDNLSNENINNQNPAGSKGKTKRGSRGRKNKGGILNSEASQIAHRNLKAAEKRDKQEIP